MSETAGVFAVVPVKALAETKSRLVPVLNPGARAGLTLYMMGRVVRALREAGVGDICIVSPDPVVLDEAKGRGAAPLPQRSLGLNPALEEGRARALAGGASALLVLPADLPLLDKDDVGAVLEAAGEGPGVVLSPDGARSGTNALLVRPPDAMPFLFGPESFEAHLGAARARGLEVRVCERSHLAFDLDTAGDLRRLEQTEVPRQ
ncbi:MAG: 2-phospho-L-lactate guanylyltransferase [Actinomycetota bacterium]|nr:2-phospho-L-lactate guanylyltransferase [Actinomycetota bacterium]